jgi:hypothetical protein
MQSDILLPEWATQEYRNPSPFPDMDSTTSRLRRLESSLQYFRRGKSVGSSSDFAAVSADALDGTGAILLNSSSGFAVSGAMPPYVVSGNFAYTSDGTSIHIYWDGTNSSNVLVTRRADNTTFTVPKGDMNVTGLSNSTTYYFYPFWVTNSGCAVSFVKGTAGSPQFAFTATDKTALQTQTLLGREALSSGAFTAATTGGGAGGGAAGGGGGGGFCVMSGTDIEPLYRDWTYETRIHPESKWFRVVSNLGHTLNAVKGHKLYHPDGQLVEIQNLKVGDWLVHRQGDLQVAELTPFIQVCTKWEIMMPKGHLYFANGFLSHNVKASEA